jgi:hypothetical protein
MKMYVEIRWKVNSNWIQVCMLAKVLLPLWGDLSRRRGLPEGKHDA